MSHATTVHELATHLAWYPANTYVHFFCRALSYDAARGVLTAQELPAFFVEACVLDQGPTNNTSSEASVGAASEARQLPVALLHIEGETGASVAPDALVQMHDAVNNCLVVSVYARVRREQRTEKVVKEEEGEEETAAAVGPRVPMSVALTLLSLETIDNQALFDDPASENVEAVLLRAVFVRETTRARAIAAVPLSQSASSVGTVLDEQ